MTTSGWHSKKMRFQDSTGELLNSGIASLSVPPDNGQHEYAARHGLLWIRASVHEKSDAVCRLQLVAAQALQADFDDRGNSPGFAAVPLPAGTISKLQQPDPAVKNDHAAVPIFWRPRQGTTKEFYTRISERLRHKDRAINMWDYEHLVLGAFPEIFQVKCLNHTQYESSDSGNGIYRSSLLGM